MILIIILAVIAIILSSIYWHQTKSRFAKLFNSFPTHNSFFPIIGHLHLIGRDPDKWFSILYDTLGTFNQTLALWAGPYGSIQVITAEDAEIILSSTKTVDKGMIYNFLHPWLGTGLLTSTGQKWQQRRKMLTPAFHYNVLEIFIEIFGERSEQLVETLTKECTKPKTDITPLVTETTLKTICESSMGIKLNEKDEDQANYFESLHKVAELLHHRTYSPWFYSNFSYYFCPLYWKQQRLLKYLHSFTNNIIKQRQSTFQYSDITDIESEDKKPKKRLAMLDLLIYNNKYLGTIDNEGIREEVDTFVFEGHDTTSAGICFSLFCLAQYPDIQQKAREELDEIFGDSKRHATYEDLQNMKYLERCIKESLRLYPSVPSIARSLTEDLQFTHHVAPAGADVFIRIYNLHRDPKYFPDPEKFDPDRFLPENSVGRHPFAYIPFSAGPRNCIGQKFAMLELKSIVSSVLRNFILEPIDSAIDLTSDLVLRVKGPIYVKFNSRQ